MKGMQSPHWALRADQRPGSWSWATDDGPLSEAKLLGAAVIGLRVHPDNVKARRLYESLGHSCAGDERSELVMLVDMEPGAMPETEVDSTPRRL